MYVYVLSAINNIKDLINCLHQIVWSSRCFLELWRTFLLFLNFGLVSAIVSLFVNRKTADSNLVSVDSDSAYTSTGFDSNISHTGGHLIYIRRCSLLHLYSVQRNLQQKPFYNKTASILHITHMPYDDYNDHNDEHDDDDDYSQQPLAQSPLAPRSCRQPPFSSVPSSCVSCWC